MQEAIVAELLGAAQVQALDLPFPRQAILRPNDLSTNLESANAQRAIRSATQGVRAIC
jgi:hypothetical protein